MGYMWDLQKAFPKEAHVLKPHISLVTCFPPLPAS